MTTTDHHGDLAAASDRFVDDVIAAVRAYRSASGRRYPYEMLAGQYPADEVLALMDELDDAEVLDYGVSLRTAWVREYDPDIENLIARFKEQRAARL